jgi:tetratricopeptide (TPR) repeat protein
MAHAALARSTMLICLAAGCAGRQAEQCARELRRGTGAEAVAACERALSRTGKPEEAGALAWALFAAGRAKEARAVVQAHDGAATGLLLLTRAALAWRSGERRGADAELERAAKRCRAAGDSFCAARAELESAALLGAMGDHRRALAAANRAAAEPAAAQEPLIKGRALSRLFDVLYELGDAEGAERVLQAIRDLRADDPQMAPYLPLKEGNLRALQGRAALAASAYLQAIEEARKAHVPAVAWSAELNLVKSSTQAGAAEEAQRHLDAAEALLPQVLGGGNEMLALHHHRAMVLRARRDWPAAARELDTALASTTIDDWRWELSLERAQVAVEAGDRAQAKKAAAQAIDAVERMREALALDELKAWLLPSRLKPFPLLFRLQAEEGDAAAALQTAERALARTLLDAFVAAHAQRAGPESEPGAEALVRAEALRTFLPALRRSKVAAPAPLPEVLARLGTRHALLWFADGASLWLFDVLQGRVRLKHLGALAQLEPHLDRLQRDPNAADAAAALGAALLPEGLIRPGEELYLIAAPPLASLPFAALRVGGRALIEEHVLHFAPSLSALAALAGLAGQAGGPGSAPVVLGDAAGDLPGARREAEAAAHALRVEALLGERARREALQAAASASVLHLAVHGGVGLGGGWLQLADGEVAASDVLRWRLQPRLVVLSACASAASRAREPWGSLSASFLAAGSRGVVASLWSVDDAATRALAERFYAEGGADRPAPALARAQRSLLAAGAPASAWSAFVLLGE